MISFKVDGMMCTHCKARVQKALEAIDGVASVEVDLQSKLVTVQGEASEEVLKAAVVKAGYSIIEE